MNIKQVSISHAASFCYNATDTILTIPIFFHLADDGTPYWLDPDTDKTSWDKPASLSWVEMQGEDGTLYVKLISYLYFYHGVLLLSSLFFLSFFHNMYHSLILHASISIKHLSLIFCRYYWNEVTKLSQWDKPVSIAWTQVVHIPGITDREQGSDAQNDTIEEEEEESEAEESVDQEDSIAIDRDL